MLAVKKYFLKLSKLIVVSGAVLSLHSCASIVGDNMRTVCVQSQPQGAGVYVDGQRVGTTPTSVTFSNYIYGGKILVVKKEGYCDQTVRMNTKFQPCGLWNLLCWPCFLIDAATGNTVKIDPVNYNLFAELQAVPSEDSKEASK